MCDYDYQLLHSQQTADTAATQAVMSPHINIVDLHECGRMGQRAQKFKEEKDLVEYTQETGRYYPLEEAYADPLLTYLLRQIDGNYLGISSKRTI